VERLGPGVLDVALVNRSATINAAILARYAAAGLQLLEVNEAQVTAIEKLGVRVVIDELAERDAETRTLWNKQDTIRHDPAALGRALWQLIARA